MGRLASLPVEIPDNVEASVDGSKITIKGQNGQLEREFSKLVKVEKVEDGSIKVSKKGNSKEARAMEGTIRSHVVNMVHGVTEGWSKALEINGAGYRAEVKGDDLVLTVGYSHPITISSIGGTKFKVEKNVVTVEGPDKEAVGHLAAKIREARKPNVYTGSGIKYQNEIIRRKAGKQAAGAGD